MPLAAPLSELQEMVDRHLSGLSTSRILEAGCGSLSNVRLPTTSRITGIDISAEQLEKNSIVTEKIVGDLQTYQLPERSYDLAICWDVLEHLESPEEALLRMVGSLKNGGLLLVACPNVYSVKALVAKAAPLSFHRLIYRSIYGRKYGSAGYFPFPTYLRWSIAPARILRFSEHNGLRVELKRYYESGVQRRLRAKYHIGRHATEALETIARVLSFGRVTVVGSDCVFLLRKI